MQVNKIRLAGMAAIILFFASPALAADLACPETIAVAPQSLEGQPPAGWRIFVDTINQRHALDRITFYDGVPEQMASLAPDLTYDNFSQWNLAGNGTRIYFISCGYGDTTVELARQVPDAFTACRVHYAKDTLNPDGTPVPEKVICE